MQFFTEFQTEGSRGIRKFEQKEAKVTKGIKVGVLGRSQLMRETWVWEFGNLNRRKQRKQRDQDWAFGTVPVDARNLGLGIRIFEQKEAKETKGSRLGVWDGPG
jgi:hypothetical protein